MALRVALVSQGDPTAPGAWSGVLSGVVAGLAAIGCDIAPISAELALAPTVARRLRMSWASQATSRLYAATSGLTGSRALAQTPDLDGVVMVGSGYTLSTDLPLVTLDDMTVAQALARGDGVYDELSAAGARRWRERQRQIYEHARGCCVTSAWAGESVQADYGVPREKVHVVGFGRNIEPAAATRDWGVPRFLWIGVDWERKRGPAVVEAFAHVRERFPDATLDLVGGHPLVEAAGVTGHGRLPVGSPAGRERLAELLGRSTCLLMPSTYEPFGIAYVDAAAAGIASVGTTVGGAPEAIGPGGRVVDPAAPEALADAMLELADPNTARQLGALARTHSELFTWQAVAERLLRALRPAGVEVDRLAPFLDAPYDAVEPPLAATDAS